jgi:deoxyxylulose-5-phosphate synthase
MRDVWHFADEDKNEALATRRERNAGESEGSQTGLPDEAEADADANGSAHASPTRSRGARRHSAQSPDGQEDKEAHVSGDGAGEGADEEAPRKKLRIVDDDE